MGKGIFLKFVTILLLFTIAACSSREYKPLTKNSSPSLNNALAVMGVRFVEKYTDPKTGDEKTIVSYELLKDEKLLKIRQVEQGAPELYRSLYYLSDFKFQWTDEQGADHEIVRFHNNMLQYENIALYELKPETYTLHGFKMRQLQLLEGKRGKSEDRWHPVFKQYHETIGTWNLPAGKITYLGDLTLTFYTEKEDRGLLSPEVVNREIKLQRIDIKDNFGQMKKALKNQKPWFPADKMINAARESEWVYFEPPVKKRNQMENEPEKQKENDKELKKKQENTFY